MLKKWDVTIPSLTGDAPRKAYIYLPEYYDEDPNRRFPVMYMFDGHNIFLDEDATYGKSWGMYHFMKSYIPQDFPKEASESRKMFCPSNIYITGNLRLGSSS